MEVEKINELKEKYLKLRVERRKAKIMRKSNGYHSYPAERFVGYDGNDIIITPYRIDTPINKLIAYMTLDFLDGLICLDKFSDSSKIDSSNISLFVYEDYSIYLMKCESKKNKNKFYGFFNDDYSISKKKITPYPFEDLDLIQLSGFFANINSFDYEGNNPFIFSLALKKKDKLVCFKDDEYYIYCFLKD